MLTNNFVGYLRNGKDSFANVIRENGDQIDASLGTSSEKTFKVSIGTGTTNVEKTDYKLESIISSGYTASVEEKIINAPSTTDTSMYSVITNITNTSSSETIQFSEIGLFVSALTMGSPYTYMIAREVFDTPITLAPGETKSFVLKLF